MRKYHKSFNPINDVVAYEYTIAVICIWEFSVRFRMQHIFPKCLASRLAVWKAFIHNTLRKNYIFALRLSTPNSTPKRDINVLKAGKRLSNGSPQLKTPIFIQSYLLLPKAPKSNLFAGKWYLLNHSLIFSRT